MTWLWLLVLLAGVVCLALGARMEARQQRQRVTHEADPAGRVLHSDGD